jgi:hypothetical protein
MRIRFMFVADRICTLLSHPPESADMSGMYAGACGISSVEFVSTLNPAQNRVKRTSIE